MTSIRKRENAFTWYLQQCQLMDPLEKGWAINLALGPLWVARDQRRAKTSGNKNKFQFKLASALTFAVLSWRIF